MVEYKASLKLKIPVHDSGMGISWDTFNVVNCDYQLERGINKNGEVCTSLKGGIITLDISDLPTKNMMGWVFDHMKKYDGEISICDVEFEPIEQIYFEKARCVDFSIDYKVGRLPYTLIRLTIVAEKTQVGNMYIENIGR